MKKAICLVLCLIIVFPLSGCGMLTMIGFGILTDDMESKDEISAFVCGNEDALLKCIDKKDFTSLKDNKIIKDINIKDIDNGFVAFDCGGSGFGSGTSYCGFYYSADDNLTKIGCVPDDVKQLKKTGNGYLWEEWEYGEGDNTYYTENICGHFYYYKATY